MLLLRHLNILHPAQKPGSGRTSFQGADQAQRFSLDEIGSTMRDALLNWPARVSGLIAAEISVDPHLLQTILQSFINGLLTDAADRFDPAGLGGNPSPQP
jgi:hypothetical protein